VVWVGLEKNLMAGSREEKARNMGKKLAKLRVSVTMTKPYVDGLNDLVEEGIYLSRGDAILEAIRRLLRSYGKKPFTSESLMHEEPQ
jgi:hypothetical protein